MDAYPGDQSMMLAPAADAPPGGSAMGRETTPFRLAAWTASSRAEALRGVAAERGDVAGGSGFLAGGL